MEQRTQEWHEARKGRVTGSIVGAILGQSPYMTRGDAMRSLVRAYHGAESEFVGGPHIDYGVTNEDEATEHFKLEAGLDVEKVGFYEYEDWAGASPDGLCSDGNGLEVKCPWGKRNGGEFSSIKDQPNYYSQMQMEMLATGWPGMWFFQWSPHNTLIEFVEPDQQWLDDSLPRLRQFYAEFISELDNPDHLAPKRVEVNTQETKRLLDEYDQLKEAIDNATERRKEVQSLLVAACGERDAEAWGRKITKVEKEGSVSYAKVVKKHCPDVDLDAYRGKKSEYWKIT